MFAPAVAMELGWTCCLSSLARLPPLLFFKSMPLAIVQKLCQFLDDAAQVAS